MQPASSNTSITQSSFLNVVPTRVFRSAYRSPNHVRGQELLGFCGPPDCQIATVARKPSGMAAAWSVQSAGV